MCIHMLLGNFGVMTQRNTDAFVPKALQNTVGIVFPSLRQFWGMYVSPPKPLQMSGVEWHVIGRLNEKAKVVSIDLLKWLQLGTVSRPANVAAGSTCSSIYPAKMWRMFFHKAVKRRLRRTLMRYAMHTDQSDVPETNHCDSISAGEECVLLNAFLEYSCKYWNITHDGTSLEAIDIYGNIIMTRMNVTQRTRTIFLPVIQDYKCKTIG